RGLVERVEQRILSLVADGGDELLEVERLPQDGGGAQDVVALGADAVEPVADRLLHALRDLQVPDRLSLPASALTPDGPLLDERLEDLLDEERIPLGLLLQGLGELLADLLAEKRAELRARLPHLEAPQDDARRQPLAVPVHEGLREGMRAVELDLAVGRHQQ